LYTFIEDERICVARYICFYFTTEAGKAPVEEFIDSLDYSTQRKFFFKKGLLEEFGQRLPYPHAKYIGDDIYELRFEGKEGTIRVLYFFYHKDEIIFTNFPSSELNFISSSFNLFINLGYLFENSFVNSGRK